METKLTIHPDSPCIEQLTVFIIPAVRTIGRTWFARWAHILWIAPQIIAHAIEHVRLCDRLPINLCSNEERIYLLSHSNDDKIQKKNCKIHAWIGSFEPTKKFTFRK